MNLGIFSTEATGTDLGIMLTVTSTTFPWEGVWKYSLRKVLRNKKSPKKQAKEKKGETNQETDS